MKDILFFISTLILPITCVGAVYMISNSSNQNLDAIGMFILFMMLWAYNFEISNNIRNLLKRK